MKKEDLDSCTSVVTRCLAAFQDPFVDVKTRSKPVSFRSASLSSCTTMLRGNSAVPRARRARGNPPAFFCACLSRTKALVQLLGAMNCGGRLDCRTALKAWRSMGSQASRLYKNQLLQCSGQGKLVGNTIEVGM